MAKKDVSRNDGSQDVLVESNEGFGLIVPKALSGVVNLKGADLIGPAAGTGLTILGTLLARRYGNAISSKIVSFAPLFGAVFGSLASIPLYWWKGSRVVTDAVLTSVAVGLGIFGYEMISSAALMPGATSGIVAERLRGIVAEPMGRMLPQISETTSLPKSVQYQIDPNDYGRAI